MAKKLPKTLDTPARQKRLLALLEEYVGACRPPPEADAKKTNGKFANLAGFCRFLGCGISYLQKLCGDAPRLYDLICTTLEVELLISSPSPCSHWVMTPVSICRPCLGMMILLAMFTSDHGSARGRGLFCPRSRAIVAF